jgi:hypothetical protein
MAPPSLIDFVLSKNLADGVVVAGCAESACFHRLGVAWTEQRFAGERDPYLRARVPRDRLKTIWASALESSRFERELGRLRQAGCRNAVRATVTASILSASDREPARLPEASVP